jgi:hypothetical protein
MPAALASEDKWAAASNIRQPDKESLQWTRSGHMISHDSLGLPSAAPKNPCPHLWGTGSDGPSATDITSSIRQVRPKGFVQRAAKWSVHNSAHRNPPANKQKLSHPPYPPSHWKESSNIHKQVLEKIKKND